MNGRILVTYASRLGSTQEVAARIGTVLNQDGSEVDVLPIADVRSVGDYDAVIVGSPIRTGRWVQESVDFLEAHRLELRRVPVAYFTLFVTLHEDTPENRSIVRQYHAPLLQDFPEIEPVSIGMFAGKVDAAQFSWLLSVMAKSASIPEGDWRNWTQIEDWARSVSEQLVPEAS